MQLYTAQRPQTEQLILAGDHTAWPRPNARTLKDRTYEHQAQLLSGGNTVRLVKVQRAEAGYRESGVEKVVGHYSLSGPERGK
jgi:hypothetical protein